MSTAKKPRQMNISDFKAQMLALVEETQRLGSEFVLLKHGKPIARVIPYRNPESTSFLERFNSLKGKVKIVGDIINFDTSDDWDALK